MIRILVGVVPALAALIGGLFFILNGLHMSTDQHIIKHRFRLRSLLLGSGMLMLMLAGIVNYIIFAIFSNVSFFIIASFIALFGLILMGIAILLINPHEIT